MILLQDIIKGIVETMSSQMLSDLKKVDPNIKGITFLYGHHTDVKERIKAKLNVDKFDVNPLVVMFEDYKITHNIEGLDGISNLKVLLLTTSSDKITREQRDEKYFKPILIPIYEKFLTLLKTSGYFQIYDETKIKHDQINRPHWGNPALYGNSAYLLDHIFDGIELSNLELQTYLKNCQ